jgi:hypothetical protein
MSLDRLYTWKSSPLGCFQCTVQLAYTREMTHCSKYSFVETFSKMEAELLTSGLMLEK